MSKVLINYDQLCGLADYARRVGTIDALADVALQWAGQADKEMERLTAALQHEADCVEAAKEEIERLTDENKMLRHTHRWNVEPQTDDSLLVCRGLHEKDEKCELEHYVPAERLHDAIREREELRRQLADARQRAEYWKAEHLAGNKEIDELRRQLAEAEQRFDWLAERLEDVQIDSADPNDHYHGDEEDVPFSVLWRRAIDAAMGASNA